MEGIGCLASVVFIASRIRTAEACPEPLGVGDPSSHPQFEFGSAVRWIVFTPVHLPKP